METKKWYMSKTLWVNVIATIAILLQSYTGSEVLDPDSQAAVLGLINIALRFATRTPLM